MRKTFEDGKNKKLDDIEAKGIATKEKLDKDKVEVANLQTTFDKNTETLTSQSARLKEIEGQLTYPKQSIEYGRDAEYVTIENRIADLKKEIEKPVEDTSSELLELKKDLTTKIDAVKKILNSKETDEKTRARIEELKAEEKQLAKKLADFEGQKFLLDVFTKTKCEIMESKINSLFKYVSFKLFDTLINGAVAPCCETLIRGVPWNDANHEGRTNGGIDIINTLTKHYEVHSPIFIDYRESTNNIIPTDSQVINLIVTKDKELTVDVEG